MGYLNPIQAELQQGGAKPPGLLAMLAARQSSEEQQFSALANANAGTTTGAELQSAAEAALLGEEVPARVQAALKAPDAGALLAVKQAVDTALEVESVAAWLQQQGRSSNSSEQIGLVRNQGQYGPTTTIRPCIVLYCTKKTILLQYRTNSRRNISALSL